MGDFNTRIEVKKNPHIELDVEKNKSLARLLIKKGEYEEIADQDQLYNDRLRKGGLFREGDYSLFAPTFKIGKQENYSTQRAPAWTDRIIYSGTSLKLMNYDSNNLIKISDHRPVFA